jgi:hypothetical protein
MELTRGNIMTGLAKAATGWRDGLLDYILEGTKQFEWVAAAISITFGVSALVLFFPADVLGKYPYPMALFITCVNIVMAVSSSMLVVALVRNDRQRRYDALRWLTPDWVLKGVVWVNAFYGVHYIWVTLALLSVILFFVCTIALYHNALALKQEKEAAEKAATEKARAELFEEVDKPT